MIPHSCHHTIPSFLTPSSYIDVPTPCVDLSVYRASLAHKANHSFAPNCAYVAMEHPRFGRIPGLKTLRCVARGEELFSHYKYDMALAPNWYVEAYEEFSAGTSGVKYERAEGQGGDDDGW